MEAYFPHYFLSVKAKKKFDLKCFFLENHLTYISSLNQEKSILRGKKKNAFFR